MRIDRNLHNFVYPDRGFSTSADRRMVLEDENEFFFGRRLRNSMRSLQRAKKNPVDQGIKSNLL